MKVQIALLVLSASGSAFALEPGHYTQRCDDATIVQYYKSPEGIEKDGEPTGVQNHEIWDLVVTKDGEWTETKQTGTFYSAADHDRAQPAPEFHLREKSKREGELVTVTIEDTQLGTNGRSRTTSSVYRIEADGSRTLLRSIDADGKATEEKGTSWELTTSDGHVISVILSSGSTYTDPEGRRWEEVSSKHVCTTVPVTDGGPRGEYHP